ncbi:MULTISPECIES: hypothetical protein [Cyanophyceae]|uniref:hypothetical protein n=1 Tax=Cyanophyceae TaxID=3028117 RepID=UPI001687D4B7|nr:hypothetical protein [Trichocoleus sp. FACHB-69]MBD1933959.1 hypothetical protein [Trichocoleus sp. FACHB-69]
MSKLSVFLDTRVVFPPYLRDTLLCIAESGLYIPYWSQKILDEATHKLVTKGITTVEQAQDFEPIIKQAFRKQWLKSCLASGHNDK